MHFAPHHDIQQSPSTVPTPMRSPGSLLCPSSGPLQKLCSMRNIQLQPASLDTKPTQMFIRGAVWESITLLLPLWPPEYKRPPVLFSFNWQSIWPRENTPVVVIPLGARLSFLHRFFGQILHCVLGEEMTKTRPDSCTSDGENATTRKEGWERGKI